MKILITNVDGQPQFTGGIKRVSLQLAHAWKQMGHQVRLLGLLPETERSKYAMLEGIEQVFLPHYASANCSENQVWLADYLLANDIDVVLHQHVEDHPMTRLCFAVKERTSMQCATKWICTLHFAPTSFIDETDAFHNHPSSLERWHWRKMLMRWKWNGITRPKSLRATRAWYKYVYEQADSIVLLSEQFIPTFTRLAGVPSTRITAIANPITLPQATRPTTKEKLVVWCGRLGGFKRLDYMLAIWKRIAHKHPDWQLAVLGSGDVTHWQGIVERHSIPNVTIAGFTDPTPYYERASIFCLTSSTEGLPMVVFEAMSYGCVPMTFDNITALRDVITHGKNGLFVPFPCEQAYANALSRLMSGKTMSVLPAKHSDSIAKNHLNVIASQWINLFEQ